MFLELILLAPTKARGEVSLAHPRYVQAPRAWLGVGENVTEEEVWVVEVDTVLFKVCEVCELIDEELEDTGGEVVAAELAVDEFADWVEVEANVVSIPELVVEIDDFETETVDDKVTGEEVFALSKYILSRLPAPQYSELFPGHWKLQSA